MSACAPDPAAPASDPGLEISAGKAPSTTDMSVSGATPDSATQDTTLDVVINGSGFVSGTAANWSLAGVQDPAQVRTNSTRYVNSRQLVANITISASAAAAKWDIVVTAAGKKGGIGTEAFTVKVRGNVDSEPRANLMWEDSVNTAQTGQPATWEPALITGDYRSRDGSPLSAGKSGEFQGSFCGSVSYLRNVDGALNFEVDQQYDSSTMSIPCGGKRFYQFFFNGRGNTPLKYGPQHFVWDLGYFVVGESRLIGIMFGIQQTGCNGLHFNSLYAPASDARVTRITDTLTAAGSARRWKVESQGNHRAMCTTPGKRGPVPTGVSYRMPFAFTITEVLYPFPRFP